MSDVIRSIAKFFAGGPPPTMNRREFLRGVGGMAASAAVPKLPGGHAIPGSAAQAVSPFMEDLSGFTGIRLSPMSDGKGRLMLEAATPESWWDRADTKQAGQDYDRLRKELFAAARGRPASPLQIMGEGPATGPQELLTLPYEWNRATGQWHAAVYDPITKGQRFLQSGASPPEGSFYPWGWESPATGIDYGISAYGRTPAELASTLQEDYGRAIARSIYERGVDPKSMRENPHYAEQAAKHAADAGIAPGGRFEQQAPLDLAPRSPRTREFDLPLDPSVMPHEPQVTRQNFRRYLAPALLAPALTSPADTDRR